jgi:hypothetical protein
VARRRERVSPRIVTFLPGPFPPSFHFGATSAAKIAGERKDVLPRAVRAATALESGLQTIAAGTESRYG